MNDDLIAMRRDERRHEEIARRGFTRLPLSFDVAVAHALAQLAHAAWQLPRDQCYAGGDRFRSLNRFRAEVLDDGVRVRRGDDREPYVQRAAYNPELPDTRREYQPLPDAVADTEGVRQLMAQHLVNLPLSVPGTCYTVNMHVIRFAASPGRPADTSPSGLHKDGEKYLATHLLARCGAAGGEVVITDNQRRELDRFTLRELGECYVFDDDAIWHMLTPVCTAEGSRFGYRDTLAFDFLPEGWEPS
jgi:hypothetical protein